MLAGLEKKKVVGTQISTPHYYTTDINRTIYSIRTDTVTIK